MLFFGQLKDITEEERLVLSDVNDSVSCLNYLYQRYPRLGNSNFRLAIDEEVVNKEDKLPLSSGAKLALMPPFSGG